jgi:hypothetical protein
LRFFREFGILLDFESENQPMIATYLPKKSLLFILSVLFSLSFFAQQAEFSYGNRWRFGLNLGGTWLASDMKNYGGVGGGFTIEKGLTRSKTAPLYFDLRYRFLAGSAYGSDTRVNHLISNNDALNGKNDSTSNYFASPGYFFNNYKTTIRSHDLELKVGLNGLLQKHKVHLYVWGGIGVTKFNTKIDALDAAGSMYSFSGLDTTGGKVGASALNFMDHKYETNADGNSGTGIVKFSPSLGIGFGYKFSNHFSLIFEHKVTFPGSDLMDGEKNYQRKNFWSASNDYYHYSGAKLLFTLGGGGGGTYTPNPNNNYVSTPTSPPDVTIISPSVNPYTSPANSVQIYANVKNVTDVNGVSVKVNGMPFSSFNFTPGSGAISFSTQLQNGSNTISITGTNAYGTDTEVINVNWNVAPSGIPPAVNISTPANNSNVQSSSVNVSATVRNVSQSSQVTVLVNGVSISSFNFNAANGEVSFPANIIPGVNTITISGTNQYGNDSKSLTLNQPVTNVVIAKPVITITNPPYSGYQSTTPSFNVNAIVTNVSASNQISVLVNGSLTTNFSFNAVNGNLTIPATLVSGNNSFIITASNTAGSDSKTTAVNYIVAPVGNPPVVSYTSPGTTPYTSSVASIQVQARVTNVTSKNDVKLFVNNAAVSNFSFNTATNMVDYNLVMSSPANVVTIMGTNTFGSDAKSVMINYSAPADPKPVVIITNPSYMPFTVANPSFSVTATVLNVTNQNQVTVNVNGQNTSNFTFNATAHTVSVPLTLNSGTTPVTITATNSSGSASKNTSLVYVAPVALPVVSYVTPNTDPFTAPSATQNVIAKVLNVTQQSQVNVLVNGISTAFTWIASTNQASFSASLNPGNNVVTVTGTNNSGSDAKNLTLVLTVKPKGAQPSVVINNPANPGTTVSNSGFQFLADVLNVTAASDISVTLNGTVATPTYNLNTGVLTLGTILVSGANNLSVTATNPYGTATATTTVNYVAPVIGKKPTVVITTPSVAGTTVSAPSFTFSAAVANVTAANQVSALYNGSPVAIQFANGTVTYAANLNAGSNSFSVTATNATGSASAGTTINYSGNPPVVTFIKPGLGGLSVNIAAYTFSASVTNVSSLSQLQAQLNGTNVPVQYANGIVTYNATLQSGNNTFSLGATNNFGADQKNASVTFNPVAKPVIQFTSPGTSGEGTVIAAHFFKANIANVLLPNQLVVKYNGQSISGFNFYNGSFSYSASLQTGNNTLEITATNVAGSDYKSTFVTYQQPVQVDCVKVTPNGGGNTNTGVGTDTTTGPSGPGGPVTNPNGGNSGNTITICHYPPGNTGNPQIIQIPKSAWPAHRAHGDEEGGTCTKTQNNNNNSGGNGGGNNGPGGSGGNNNSGGNNGGTNNNSNNTNQNDGKGNTPGGGIKLNPKLNPINSGKTGNNTGTNTNNTTTPGNSNSGTNTGGGTNTNGGNTNTPTDENKNETKPKDGGVNPKLNIKGGKIVPK